MPVGIQCLDELLGPTKYDLGPRLIDHFGDLRSLSLASEEDLFAIPGMTAVRARRLWLAFQLGRMSQDTSPRPDRIDSPEASARLLAPHFWGQTTEALCALYLNRAQRSKGIRRLSQGNDQYTVVCPRQILRHALQLNATGVVLAHNHPSGDLTPSMRDRQVTQTVSVACKTLGINLIDHLIFTERGWTSMARLNLTSGPSHQSNRWLH